MDAETFYGLGLALIFAGILVTLVAVVSLVISSVKAGGKGEVKGGGAVIIGPFPIIFGTDKESVKTILWLSLTLTALLVIFTVISYLISKR